MRPAEFYSISRKLPLARSPRSSALFETSGEDQPFPSPASFAWYSAKRAGVKRACPNKVMAHIWFMHDAHLGRTFLFLDMLAEYTLLSMTVMVTILTELFTRQIPQNLKTATVKITGYDKKSPVFFSRSF